MKVTVDLKDVDKVCRVCGVVSATTRQRSYRGKSYQGPCGDSFCYASCNMATCTGVNTRACDTCATAGKEPR